MAAKIGAILLDTCAAIWLAAGELEQSVVERVVHAGLTDGIYVSPVSAWEVGLLAYPARGGGMTFDPDPQTWFARLMARPGIRRADLTERIAIGASLLPGDFHRDPADRLLAATARDRGFTIMTRDRKILDYAAAGHVVAIAC